jgi:hypothetical protein
MAHGTEKRTQLRGLFVYKRLTMEAACGAMTLPVATGRRWKREAKANGDDWDTARSAVALGDDNFRDMSRRLLEDYITQHEHIMGELKADKNISALDRIKAMGMLSDSLTKTLASMKRVMPEVNRHAIALDALQRLATFAQSSFPQHVPSLIEMLEPFGEELAKAYG